MLVSTSKLVKQHMDYLRSHPNSADELNQFETLFDHMFYYFTVKLGMTENEAKAAVMDFSSDFDANSGLHIAPKPPQD